MASIAPINMWGCGVGTFPSPLHLFLDLHLEDDIAMGGGLVTRQVVELYRRAASGQVRADL